MQLETVRLNLRNWRESDVDSYMILASDVGYNCFVPPGYFQVRDRTEAKGKILGKIRLFDERGLGKFPVFLKQNGEFIGTCGIEPFDMDGQAEVELGYRICLKHWGNGYATEAATAILRYGFGDLELEKIMALALPQNRASLRILEKLGFRYLRDFTLFDNLPFRLYEIFPRSAVV